LVNQALINAAYQAEELRLDRAEAAVDEALRSDDSRRRDRRLLHFARERPRQAPPLDYIVLRGVDVSVHVNTRPKQYVIRWSTAKEEERGKAEAALEALRLKTEAARLINPDLAAPDEPAGTTTADTNVRMMHATIRPSGLLIG
jgi:hypothetical protein